MKRQREGMQVNVAGLRRNIMNLAHNYSGAQVKVREATSNDPWGPNSTLMSEIADLTYNVVAFTEIMQMVWKRLNDHGRNWRHVYKALVLLDYLIKTGSEKVAQQCKENIFAIQTLRDFQYVEEGKDQGINVREKAKQLVLLLKDDERLRNERARALKAKERFAQTASGFGSDTGLFEFILGLNCLLNILIDVTERMSCGAQSKAFVKSHKLASVLEQCSKPPITPETRSSTAPTVDKPLRKPN
ncbi:Epsin-2 [Homalodisca vitripennis]|nr:Epsin-2 [Homalodisca vitripennis]